jgi:hypothetical protein
VFDIVEWTGMDAKEATNEAEEATPAVEETSRRRRSV